jgi:parvulin-like peptidyl-prolyl isomerase
MILDIVGASMEDTTGRGSARMAGGIGRGPRRLSFQHPRGLPALVAGAIALLWVGSLGACGGTQREAPTPVPTRSSTVVIATVEPSTQPAKGQASAVPTLPPPTLAPTPTPPAPLAATVNGQYIFLADYERRVVQFQQAMVDQGLDPASADGQASLAEVRKEVLASLIDYALIEQGGAALGITLTDADLEAQIQADITAGGGQAEFEKWLQATGQTRDDYKEMLRESLLSQQVMAHISAGVSDTAEEVHARQIVVDTEAQAQAILTSLRQGADFVSTAREQSVDVATRDNGGDLGWFPRGLIAPELEEVAFTLQPGEISDVIQLGEGYHIIQVVERDAARSLSPEEKGDLIFALFDRWLAEQRAAAVIERFIDE